MVFRRRDEKQAPLPTALPAWRRRLDEAREVAGSAGSAWDASGAFDDAERAIERAHGDLARLDEAIASLDPDRTARELKEALRAHPPGAAPQHDPLVVARRTRYETLHELQDRRDDLSLRIDTTLAEIETVAARLVGASLRDGSSDDLRSCVAELRLRAAALAAAHDELQPW